MRVRHKKDKIMPLTATWMELEILILSEVSEDKYHMISLISVEMNLSTGKKKKLMDLENRLVLAKGKEEGVGWTGNLG